LFHASIRLLVGKGKEENGIISLILLRLSAGFE